MNAPTAQKQYIKNTNGSFLLIRRIPFEIASPKLPVTREDGMKALLSLRVEAAKNGLQGMTLEEINEEIAAVRSAHTESED